MKGATMAKKSKSGEGVNKAQIIRDALKKLGIDAAAKDVQAFAGEQGVELAPAQISNIRTKLKEGGKKKRGRKPGKSTSGESSESVVASDLIQARIMAEKVGGVERAKSLLDLLNKLR